MSWKIVLLLIGVCFLSKAESKKHYKVVCYFTNWAVQRPGLGAMTPEHIDPCLCTHLIYAFSDMKDFKLSPMEKIDHSDGGKPGFFERFNNLKKKNPRLRTLLAVGGWEMGMSAFSEMVKDDKNIKKFVDASIEYLRKWNFDGLDLDFEYPGIDWRGSQPSDKYAFTKLCKMLREGYEAEAKATGKTRLLLTAAVAGAKPTIDKAYEVDKVSNYIDWWNLMTYDLHGPWDTNAGHHSAIFGKDKDDYLYIDFIIKHYESKGAPRSKLVLGLANYGRSDAPAMPYTGFKGESGFLSYYESCLMLSCEKWKEFWNEAQLVPYAKGKENYPWAGYDNVNSIKIKAEYILKENLGGAMFWTIDLDDFTGKFCCQGYFPLIRAVKSVLENVTDFMPPKTICNACGNKEYKAIKKKNKKRRSAAEDVCEEKGEGIWPDTEDCKKYYICRSIATAWGEKKEELCYPGSYFDKAASQCKWVGEGNYDCKDILAQNKEQDGVKTKNDKNDSEDNSNSEPSIVPESKYTCRADTEEDYESNPDYIKCFSCEAEVDNPQKCNGRPDNQTSETVWCNTRQKRCFSKAVYKKANNALESFSRGCASVGELSKNKASGTLGNNRAACVRDGKTKSCFVMCDSNYCNTITEIKSGSVRSTSTINKLILVLSLLIIRFL